MAKTPKKIGLLFGMENTFPWALIDAVNAAGNGAVVCEAVHLGALADRAPVPYDVIVDRISHEVPFYRTWLKTAVAAGATVINDPFWWSADDKYFGNVVALAADVAVPKTMLLPHKHRPPNTTETSFRNLDFVDWDAVFAYIAFPMFLKPAYGGGWKDVYNVEDSHEFFAAYDNSRDLTMMAQEAIAFTEYYRCYAIGRSNIRLMRYDPARPFHERYVRDAPRTERALEKRIRRDAIALCEALGYDMNTVEFAVRDGIPYAIDFTNPAPDADRASVGEENFAWVIGAMTEMLIERALHPQPYSITGTWPQRIASREATR